MDAPNDTLRHGGDPRRADGRARDDGRAHGDLGVAIGGYADADYDAVFRLWERSDLWMRPSDGRAQVALKLARDPELFLIARAGAAVVGSVMGGWDGRRAYVYHLAVDPDWRRRGVGDALMDELEERLRRKGALKVKLQVIDGNTTSQRFFAARGYEVETMCIPFGKELVAGGAPLERTSDAAADPSVGGDDGSVAAVGPVGPGAPRRDAEDRGHEGDVSR